MLCARGWLMIWLVGWGKRWEIFRQMVLNFREGNGSDWRYPGLVIEIATF